MNLQQIPKQEIIEFIILPPYGSIESGGLDRYDYEGKEIDEGIEFNSFF